MEEETTREENKTEEAELTAMMDKLSVVTTSGSEDETAPLKMRPRASYPEKIKLLTVDKQLMIVDFAHFKESVIMDKIDELMEEDSVKDLTLVMVEEFATKATLSRVFDWVSANRDIDLSPEDLCSKIKLPKEHAEYFDQLSIDEHTSLILVANHLKALPLLHYSLQALANKLSSMDVDTMRASLDIPAPTLEQDKQLREKFSWALLDPPNAKCK